MNKCPFCGAKKSSPYALEFRCGTTGLQHFSQITWRRANQCYEKQLARLQRELEAQADLLREAEEVIRVVTRPTNASKSLGNWDYECVYCQSWAGGHPRLIQHTEKCVITKAIALLRKLEAARAGGDK